MQFYLYELYGLLFNSNQELEGFNKTETNATAANDKLQLVFSKVHKLKTADYGLNNSNNSTAETSYPIFIPPKQPLNVTIVFTDSFEFIINPSKSMVRISYIDESSFDQIKYFLFGHIMSIILRFKGFLCIHANSIQYDGKAILLLGPEKSGKSTLSAYFTVKGNKILSDDLTVINNNLIKTSNNINFSRPRAGLLNKFVSEDNLTLRKTPYSDEYYYDFIIYNENQNSDYPDLPVAAIYYLSVSKSNLQKPNIYNLSHLESFIRLKSSIWMPEFNTHYTLENEFRQVP